MTDIKLETREEISTLINTMLVGEMFSNDETEEKTPGYWACIKAGYEAVISLHDKHGIDMAAIDNARRHAAHAAEEYKRATTSCHTGFDNGSQ